jgi:glycosyltransferase involved in cell wall biosynthesis
MTASRLNIALVTPFGLDPGGLATMVVRMRQGLEARGQRALILASGDSGEVRPLGVPGAYGIYLRRWPQDRPGLKPVIGFTARLAGSLRAVSSFLERERIDVVHLHFPLPASLYVAALKPLRRFKLVATFHGTDGYALGKRTWWYRAMLRRVLARADAVTAVSGDLLRTVTRVYPEVAGRSRVILNCNPMVELGPATSAAALPPGPPAGYVLAVGSLITRKGYDLLIRAVGLARDRGRKLDLVIVGTGPEAGALGRLVKELGLGDRIQLFGEVPHEAVKRLYAGASFFVHSAREEAFGLVLLEAMACRKAVIAPRLGGIPEFVQHERSGLLVEPESPAALAEAMIRLSDDGVLRESLADRGFDFVTRERTWDRLIDEYLETYQTVARPT